MTLGEVIIIAKEMQKWRRSEPPYDGGTPKTYKGMPFTTEEFGLAVDQLIELEETLDELQERVNKAEARNKEMVDKAKRAFCKAKECIPYEECHRANGGCFAMQRFIKSMEK